MASAKRFEELIVWQKSRELTREIYQETRDWKDYGLRDQIRRAAVSVLSNIAEGFERGSNTELIQFLYIARGSAAEVRAQLFVALDTGYVERLTFNRLTDHAEAASAMLYKFIESVKSSKFKGSKFKTQKDTELQEFNQFLADVVAGRRPASDIDTL